MFQYQGVKKIRLGRQHWSSGEEEDWGLGSGVHRQQQAGKRWDSSMYERVFLHAEGALTWESWNR